MFLKGRGGRSNPLAERDFPELSVAFDVFGWELDVVLQVHVSLKAGMEGVTGTE